VLPQSFFEQIAIHMPAETKFFLWKLNGRLVAFDLCLVSNHRVIDEYIGLDYAVAYQYHLYFDTYRIVIRWCIENGVQSYEAGDANYETKKRLGFTFVSQYIYAKHRNPIVNIFLGFLGLIIRPENFDPFLKSMKTHGSHKETSTGLGIAHV